MDKILDIVLPSYGLPQLTVRCLRSIQDAGGSVRVIWIDSSSPADHRIVAKFVARLGFDVLAVQLSERVGFIRATNIGLCLTQAPFVALLNNDTEVPIGWAERLCQTAGLPGVGVVGPLSTEENSPQYHGYWKRWGDVPKDKICGAGGMVSFFCCVMPRQTIETVGLLSTDYDPGHVDDDDYCERIRRAGLDVVVDLSVIVKHQGRATWNQIYTPEELTDLIQRNREKFLHDRDYGLYRQSVPVVAQPTPAEPTAPSPPLEPVPPKLIVPPNDTLDYLYGLKGR